MDSYPKNSQTFAQHWSRIFRVSTPHDSFKSTKFPSTVLFWMSKLYHFLPWNFRVWVLQSCIANQSVDPVQTHKRRLTCKSSSLAKIQHLHTVCEKQSIHHRSSLCMDTRQPHFSRGVSLQLEGMNLGKSTRHIAKKEQCLNRCSYVLQHLKFEMWKHDVQGHTHLNGSKSKSFTSLQKEAF
jgi:hypothetical protein